MIFNSRILVSFNEEQDILFEITQLLSYLATLGERVEGRLRPRFGAKFKVQRRAMFHIVYLLQSIIAFGILNPLQ